MLFLFSLFMVSPLKSLDHDDKKDISSVEKTKKEDKELTINNSGILIIKPEVIIKKPDLPAKPDFSTYWPFNSGSEKK